MPYPLQSSQLPQYGGVPDKGQNNQFGGLQGLINPRPNEDILQQFLGQRQGLINPFLQQFQGGQSGFEGFGLNRPGLSRFPGLFGGGHGMGGRMEQANQFTPGMPNIGQEWQPGWEVDARIPLQQTAAPIPQTGTPQKQFDPSQFSLNFAQSGA